MKQEKEEDGNRPRGIVRPRDDESPHSRSVRRRLRVQQEFQNVLPGYIPYIAEYAAQRIGCSLVPRPLTPELPPVSSSETQTSPTPPVTVSSSFTQMTPPPSPPTAGSATSPPQRPPPPRITGRRTVAIMSTTPRPRPVRVTESTYTVLRGTTPARPPPPAIRRPPSAALGSPPRDGNDSEQEEGELPDLPETRHSPAVSDVTIMRLV